MIELSQLSIGYKARGNIRTVASDITGTIRDGELTCLLGTNGAGKSTLLRTLAGFQPQLGGTIRIGGRELGEYSGKELAQTVSVVLTEKSDLPNMTAEEVVALGRSPHTGFWGVLSAYDKEAVAQAISLTGIDPLARRRVHTLSDGERQKVMIAKALAQDTPIILLDEPTAFLDFPSKVDAMRLLHRLSRQTGKTIFLSTHDMELALQAADCLWLICPGQPLAIGAPEDLALNGALSGAFERDGVCFNAATGLFDMDFSCHATVRLTGDSPQLAMVRKALRRNGYADSGDSQALTAIHASGDGYTISQQGNAIAHASSIGQLIEALRGLDA